MSIIDLGQESQIDPSTFSVLFTALFFMVCFSLLMLKEPLIYS